MRAFKIIPSLNYRRTNFLGNIIYCNNLNNILRFDLQYYIFILFFIIYYYILKFIFCILIEYYILLPCWRLDSIF